MKKKYLPAVLAGVTVLISMGCAYQDTVSTTAATTAIYEESGALLLSGENFTGEVPYTQTPRVPDTTGVEKGSDAANPPPDAQQSTGTRFIGYSDNGYEIKEINGVTYVGGTLIANKTYGLPSTYNPGGLTSECQAAFNKLVAGAREDGLSIYIVSGFRSYATQQRLYNNYCASDGQAAADTYSARPGHSEHQTGLAIDVNSLSHTFADTAEGKWLAANAHKYGFIIRYGKNKQSVTGYVYEPWHIRYVGVDLAQDVYNSGLSLEEYFGISSSYS